MITNINRYKPDNDGRLWPASDGEYVLYADHVAALALLPGEPVGYIDQKTLESLKEFGGLYRIESPKWHKDGDSEDIPLYASPAPLPVAVRATEKEMILLRIIEASGGNCDSSESKWSWLNWFCNDETEVGGSDTFNRCNDKGWLRTTHNSDWDTSTTTLTEAGRSALSSPVGRMEETFTRAQMLAEVERRVERALLAKRLVGEARAEFEAENATPASDIAALREKVELLSDALLQIKALDYSKAAINAAAHTAHLIAVGALQHVAKGERG